MKDIIDCLFSLLDDGVMKNEIIPIKSWIYKYRNRVKNKENIICFFYRDQFMSDKNMKSFRCWIVKNTNATIDEKVDKLLTYF